MNKTEIFGENYQKWENIFSLFDDVSKINVQEKHWLNNIFDQLILDEHELSDSFFEKFLNNFKNIFIAFKNKPISHMLIVNTIELVQIDSKFSKHWLLFLIENSNSYKNNPKSNLEGIKDALNGFKKTGLNSKQEGLYFLFFDFLKEIHHPISLDLRNIFNIENSSSYTLETLKYYKARQNKINVESFCQSYDYWLISEAFNCNGYGFNEFSQFNLKKHYSSCLFLINDIVFPLLTSEKKHNYYSNLMFNLCRFSTQISYAMNDKKVFRDSLRRWKNYQSSLDAEFILKSCSAIGISGVSKINLFSEFKLLSPQWHTQLKMLIVDDERMSVIVKNFITSTSKSSQKALHQESWMLPLKIKLSDSLYSQLPSLIKEVYELKDTSNKYYNKVFGVIDGVSSKFFNENFRFEEFLGSNDPNFALFIQNCINKKNEKTLLENVKKSNFTVSIKNRF